MLGAVSCLRPRMKWVVGAIAIWMVILIGFIFFGNTNTAVYMDATPVRRTDDVQTVLKGDNGGQSPVKRLEKRPMDTDTAPPFALKGNQGEKSPFAPTEEQKPPKTMTEADLSNGDKEGRDDRPPTQPDHHDEAFVFVLTNDKPMQLLWALEGSLRNVSTTRRRIALVSEGVGKFTRDVLKNMSIEVRDVRNLYHRRYYVNQPRWKDTLTKLVLWEMKDIKKFFYLDVDVIVLHNLDHVFDLDTTGGTIHAMRDNHACKKDWPNMNAGLFLGSPNVTIREDLYKALDNPDNPTKGGTGDQDLFNFYFQKNNLLQFRPEEELAFVWRCSCMIEGSIAPYDLKKVKAIHFTGWWIDVTYLVPNGHTEPDSRQCAEIFYRRFIDMHRFMDEEWKREHGTLPKLPMTRM